MSATAADRSRRPETLGELRAAAGRRAPSSRSCGPTSSPASRSDGRSSRASSATTSPSSPRSRTRSSPARTSSSSASAARRRPASPGCSSASSTRRSRSSRRRAERRPARADLAAPAARASPSTATTRRSSGSRATGATARSSRRPTSPSPTSSARSTRSGRRGPLPVRRADDPLRPHPALEPRHLRDQRAAGPRRAHPGRPAQHPRGARRPDPRLHDPPAARPVRRRVSANPEDYTSRGRIITPLKDRLGSQIRTHYPRTLEHEIAIMAPGEDAVRRGRRRARDRRARLHGGAARRADPPRPALARDQPALRRAACGCPSRTSRCSRRRRSSARSASARPSAAPRVSDLGAVIASTVGKIELESVGDEAPEERIVERLITKALFTTFGRRVDLDDLDDVVLAFEDGLVVETGERVPSREYVRWMREIPGCTTPSAGSARSTSPTGRRSRRSSRRRSSSSSRGCISTGGSTRIAPRRAGSSTAADRGALEPRSAGSGGARRDRDRPRPAPRSPAARYARWDGTQTIPPSTPTRSSTRWPTTSWPRATFRGAPPADGARLADERPDPSRPRRAATSSASGSAVAARSSRSATSSRRPRRRPPGARRHRRPGAGGHRAAAGRGRHAAGRLAAPTRPCGRCSRDAAARRIDQLDALPRDVGGRIRAARGVRLHGAGGARPVQRADRAAPQADARPVRGGPVGGDPGHDARRSSRRTGRWSATSTSCSRSGWTAASRARTRSTTSSRKHGRFFPGARTLDDIVEQLTQRMAAMASLLRSMTPSSAPSSRIDDGRAAARRPAPLGPRPARVEHGPAAARRPRRGLRVQRRPAARARARRSTRSASSRRSTGSRTSSATSSRRATSTTSTATRSRDLLGPDSARDLDALDELAARLEEAGYLERKGDRLELTPRGSRRIGQKVLDDLFARLSRDAFGGHRIDRPVAAGSARRRPSRTSSATRSTSTSGARSRTRSGARRTRRRRALAPRRPGVRLSPADFEVFRTEQMTRTSTVLLVDMSRSMLLRGCFVAAKKVAVALDTLIRTQFPHDDLSVIGFAYYARELRPEALAELTWHGYEYGTNLQHGLMLARRILNRQRGGDARSSSSPTASRPPTSRTARSSSAIRRPGGRSRRPSARSSAAPATGSRSTRSCSSGRGRSPSSWRS